LQTAMTKKEKKKKVRHFLVAAPGDTNPSDATDVNTGYSYVV